MIRNWKLLVLAVLAVLAVVGGTSIGIMISRSKPIPEVYGTYVGENGSEITFKDDGTFTDVAAPVYFGIYYGGEVRYRVVGDSIEIGTEGHMAQRYTIEDDGTLIGGGARWMKQEARPDRPSNLVGTYVAGHEHMISLDGSGAAYFQEVSPDSSEIQIWVEVWEVEDGKLKVTQPDYSTNRPQVTFYEIGENKLMGRGVELSKNSDEAIIPVAK